MHRRLRTSKLLARMFAGAFERHCDDLHNADYEVCHDLRCRVTWFVERCLWYGGQR